ncbi:GNAT family N-acetyltransferase [Reyranella sp.]|uniref:GNAT family N-acetyltransferase n=1 Tax=Reyranella sp. TaxID=1929291 RepID=UPI003C7BDFA3
MIRHPHPPEIKLLPQIENEADLRYRRVGLGRVVDMPPASLASLEAGRREGRLWVAVSPLGRPIGFALMKFPGSAAWLDQLSVLTRWQGYGFGSALIEQVATAARSLGHRTLHLSTYRDVSWNAPYYSRRSFVEMPRGDWPHIFRMQAMEENQHGHPPWRRTIMRRSLD